MHHKDDELLCPKCGDEIDVDDVNDAADDADIVATFSACVAAHNVDCAGPDYRGVLVPCPFCGSRDVDPEGWTSGGCDCPDSDAHKIMQCKTSKGPCCDDCGATANSTDQWNQRITA